MGVGVAGTVQRAAVCCGRRRGVPPVPTPLLPPSSVVDRINNNQPNELERIRFTDSCRWGVGVGAEETTRVENFCSKRRQLTSTSFIIGLLRKNYEVNQFHAPAKVTTAAVLTLFSIHNHVYQKIIDANKIYQCNDYTFKDKN